MLLNSNYIILITGTYVVICCYRHRRFELLRRGKPCGAWHRAEVMGDAQITARREMGRRMLGQYTFDDATFHDVAQPVVEAMKNADKVARKAQSVEQHQQHMQRSIAPVLVHVTVWHGQSEGPFLIEVPESVRLVELEKVIEARCGPVLAKSSSNKLYGIDHTGEIVELINSEVFGQYAEMMWCRQWTLHVANDEESLRSLSFAPMARFLFDCYDVDCDGWLGKIELLRLMNDLLLERLDVSELLLMRFVDAEFNRVVKDGSQMDRMQFIGYTCEMVRWARRELRDEFHIRNVFTLLAERAAQTEFPPTEVHTATSGNRVGGVAPLHMGRLGMSVSVPSGALYEAAASGVYKLAAQVIAPSSVSYLSEDDSFKHCGRKRPFVPFSSVVRIEYPAFESGVREAPELGGPQAPAFKRPLALTLPHCFQPELIHQSSMLLGAPHGASHWEHIADGILYEDDDLINEALVEKNSLQVKLPYAGTFCLVTNPDVDENVMAARFFVFANPSLARDEPSTFRVHLAPNLPDHIRQMQLQEEAEWGRSKCVGTSCILYLWHGVRFALRYLDQHGEVTWLGVRCRAEFTIPASRTASSGACGDTRTHNVLKHTLSVGLVAGEGVHGSSIIIAAKRAGIPQHGYRIAFTTLLDADTTRPPKPVFALAERTVFHFSISWAAPKSASASKVDITHYSVELATPNPNGTYKDYSELWCGAGHMHPDFTARLGRRNSQATAKGGDAPSSRDDDGASGRHAALAKAEHPQERFTYLLEVDPSVTGKLRMRCWARGEPATRETQKTLCPTLARGLYLPH